MSSKKWAYYNDNDPFVCEWARNLIKANLVMDGEVDCRDINTVDPKEIGKFVQAHFFCGILGWPYALRLAGWPENRPVWTGSCPCQPFSCAGKGKGDEDNRHLWPAFRRLIEIGKPPAVFGEQVASKDGRLWLDGVRIDLEDLGYAVGAADLCAAGCGAPHIRQRLFWVADRQNNRLEYAMYDSFGRVSTPRSGSTNRVADTKDDHGRGRECGAQAGIGQDGIRWRGPASGGFWSDSIAIPCADGKWRRVPGRVGNSMQERRHAAIPASRTHERLFWESIAKDAKGRIPENKQHDFEVEPALFPLADGILNRVGTLRGAGNAIVPQVAAEFIGAFMDVS
jgi:DNA (cytosine-5)-methyltransferase 1